MLVMHAASDAPLDKLAMLGASSPVTPSATFAPPSLQAPVYAPLPPSPSDAPMSPTPPLSRELLQHYAYLRYGSKDGTSRRQHVCPVKTCGRRFSTPGNLSRHKRLHGPVKPLMCPVDGCICAFRSENKLEKHMKFHLGIPVHVCPVPACGKTFSTAGNLNRHIKGHHPHVDPLVARSGGSISGASSSCDDEYESSVTGDEAMHERWEEDAAHQERQYDASRLGSQALAAPSQAAPAPVDQLDALVAILDQDIGDASSNSSAPVASDMRFAAPETESMLSLLLVATPPPPEVPARKYSLLDDMIRFHINHIDDDQDEVSAPTYL